MASYTHGRVLLVLGLWPMGLFLRMGYSESLFFMVVLLVFVGIQQRWPDWLVAVIAGSATGTRSVGIALLLPLLWGWCQRSRTTKEGIVKAIRFGPLACWGLLSYMGYLQLRFGDAFAFVQTQEHWAMRSDHPLVDRAISLVILEPIWTVYVPGSPAYWAAHEYVKNPLFSLHFWNPIYFVTCAGLVAYGAWKKWLTTPEWLLSIGLLGIPYVLQSHRMMMLGHGRFTCVVFPMFIVLGRLMARWPSSLQAIVFALMAVQLFYWSALFAAWHRVF